MTIQSQVWHVAKDAAYPAEYEDAFFLSNDLQRAAIADGVSAAIFSGRWARILTRTLVESPPDLSQTGAWGEWLARPRQLWMEDIDFPRLPSFQKNKLRQVGGAFSTLCWVELQHLAESGQYRASVAAVGDSCVFLIRDRQLVDSFPLTTSEEFGLDPDSICSVARSGDASLLPKVKELNCVDGDILMLVTDALGDWLLKAREDGNSAPWEKLWSLSEEDWCSEVEALRNRNLLKRDDTTLVLLYLGDGTPAWAVQQADPTESEIPEIGSADSHDLQPTDIEGSSPWVSLEPSAEVSETHRGRTDEEEVFAPCPTEQSLRPDEAEEPSDATGSDEDPVGEDGTADFE